ncbi:MAG: hypothetical protein J6Y69_01915 [Treponema sp.]|nr:hypothetical protein [Treponema sp.]
MKKFGIIAVFALLFSTGLWAQPKQTVALDSPLTMLSITDIPLSVSNELPSDSYQLMSRTVGDQMADTLTELIIEILGWLWGYNNLGVTYDYYPYATNPKYLCFDSTADQFDLTFANHFYRFAVDTSCFYDMNLWFGNSIRFEGLLWKFFGPVVELNSYIKTLDGSNPYLTADGYKGNLRIGGDISLIQTNPLTVLFYMQWNHYFNIPLGNSLDLGFILRSYPIKPVLIEWRVNWQLLNEFDKAFFESHLEAGAMVAGPLEAFAAWNYKLYEGFNYTGHGFEAGVRLHF